MSEVTDMKTLNESMDLSECCLYRISQNIIDYENHEINKSIYYKYLHLYLYSKYYGKLNSNDYDFTLLKNDFELVYEDNTKKLFDYLEDKEDIICAGGYMTQMNYRLPFKKSSDIDLFIRSIEAIRSTIEFIKETYTVISYTVINSVAINIICEGMREIQIIYTNFNSVIELLSSFNASYMKNAYYMGDTYTTYDAKWTKQNKKTYFYTSARQNQIEKISYYDLEVIYDFKTFRVENKIIELETKIEQTFDETNITIYKYIINSNILPEDVLESLTKIASRYICNGKLRLTKLIDITNPIDVEIITDSNNNMRTLLFDEFYVYSVYAINKMSITDETTINELLPLCVKLNDFDISDLIKREFDSIENKNNTYKLNKITIYQYKYEYNGKTYINPLNILVNINYNDNKLEFGEEMDNLFKIHKLLKSSNKDEFIPKTYNPDMYFIGNKTDIINTQCDFRSINNRLFFDLYASQYV